MAQISQVTNLAGSGRKPRPPRKSSSGAPSQPPLEDVEKLWASLSALADALVEERRDYLAREEVARADAAALRERVTAQAAAYDRLAERLAAERDEHRAELARVDRARVEALEAVSARLDAAVAENEALTERCAEIEAAARADVAARAAEAAEARRNLEATAARLAGALAELGDRVVAVETAADASLEAGRQLATRCEAIEEAARDAERVAAAETAEARRNLEAAAARLAGSIDELEERLDGTDDRLRACAEAAASAETAASEASGRLAAVDDRITRQIEAIGAHADRSRGEVDARLRELQAEVTNSRSSFGEQVDHLGRRLASTVNSLPRSLVVNRDGDLVAVDGEGKLSRIGRVAGDPGRDGTAIDAVAIEDGQLVVTLSGGRRMRAGPVATPQRQRSDDEILAPVAARLRAEKLTQAKICAVLRVSRARLRRLLADAATDTA